MILGGKTKISKILTLWFWVRVTLEKINLFHNLPLMRHSPMIVEMEGSELCMNGFPAAPQSSHLDRLQMRGSESIFPPLGSFRDPSSEQMEMEGITNLLVRNFY